MGLKSGALGGKLIGAGGGGFLLFYTNDREKLIKNIEEKWKGKKTAEIVDFTHKQLPYLYAMENEVVSYGLFTQENPDEIF